MRYMIAILLFFTAFSTYGCKGTADKKAKPSQPVTETVKTSYGDKLKRTLVGSEKEKIEEIMAQTIEGKIKLIYVHPQPETLPLPVRQASAFVTIVLDNGEMFFPAGELTEKLRPNAGKRTIVKGIEKRERARFKGQTYKLIKLVKVVSIEE